MGFAVPLASWFRGPLKEKYEMPSWVRYWPKPATLMSDYLHELVDQHQSAYVITARRLWALLMFESFLRNQQAN